VTYTRFGCEGGSVAVLVQSDPALHHGPSTVRFVGTDVHVLVPPDGRAHSLIAPLFPADGRCTATFAVSPTAIPGRNDPRALGLHFDSFDYRR
jgi:hypothetical protein